MPDGTGGLDPRLWRAVIRPLLCDGVSHVLFDSPGEDVAERVLAISAASVSAVAPAPSLDPLVAVYGERLSVHDSVAEAWAAGGGCDLAVVDVSRGLPEHVDIARRAAAGRGRAAGLLVHGVAVPSAGSEGDSELRSSAAVFTEHGWLVLELPGFAGAQLAFPAPDDRLARRASLLVARLEGSFGQAGNLGSEASVRPRRGDVRPDKLAELLRAVSQQRDEAERRRAVAEELTEVLGATLEQVTLAFDQEHGEVSALRNRLAETDRRVRELEPLSGERDRLQGERDRLERERGRQQSELLPLRAERDRLERERAQLEERVEELDELRLVTAAELDRLAKSQSWRIGHFLTRTARVLTFRKPGRTDGIKRAAEKLERGTPGR